LVRLMGTGLEKEGEKGRKLFKDCSGQKRVRKKTGGGAKACGSKGQRRLEKNVPEVLMEKKGGAANCGVINRRSISRG